MGDDARETTESKEAVDRAKVVRERREADRRRRLDELRAHAAAAEAQRERLNEERRKRLAEQRAKDENRWQQVEENKRALCEASVSRSESLRMRERLREERLERMERARATRSSPRAEFAFGSSTPRLLEPHDSGFWAARSTNPIDQMNFFDSLTASTSNVMFASAPLTRRASPLHFDSDVENNRDEPERSPQPIMWSSVARRRTDLVPTVPLPRAPGRAYSMTRLDKIPSQRPLHHTSPSMHHLNRIQPRSGDTTPGSRPGSAMSSASAARRTTSVPHKARPASIAGTGVNTPRGGGDTGAQSAATTPSVSRDGTVMACGDVPRRAPTAPRRPRPASMHEQSKQGGAGGSDTGLKSVAPTSSDGTKTARGDVPRRAPSTPRRPRPSSMHVHSVQDLPTNHSDVKPPLPRKPKKRFIGNTLKFLGFGAAKTRDEKSPASPGRAVSPAPGTSEEPSGDRQVSKPIVNPVSDNNEVNAIEVTQALEALQIQNGESQSDAHNQNIDNKINENKENLEEPVIKPKYVGENKPVEVQKPAEQKPTEPQKVAEEQKPVSIQKPAEREEEKNERSQERAEESEMTASMTAKRITTEEEAKAALAERRRKAREELEKHAELERQRLQREAEEEEERQRQEEERQRREEEEARELARLQRQMEEDKLRTAIEAQQQRQREESERKVREEAERQARLKEEEEKRKAAEEAERLRREEAEREEKERLARKQRVEAIMARTRLKKEEDKKQQENKAQPGATAAAASPAALPADNGNGVASADLLGLTTSQTEEKNVQEGSTVQSKDTAPEAVAGASATATPNNGNVTANLLGLSEQKSIEDKPTEQMAAATNKQAVVDNSPNGNMSTMESNTNNGNFQHNLLEPTSNVGSISANFIQTERMSTKLIEDDFTAHNGHGDHNYTI